MSGTHPPAVVRSAVDRKRRMSLIWAIPVVTLLIGGWLAWKTLSNRGPVITITFETAEGLQVTQSHVRHKEVDMGVVQKIALTPDRRRVQVSVQMNKESQPLLTDKAQFWVVRPRFFAGSITGLSTLFSGSYIDVLPSAEGGSEKTDFVGLENPPVMQSDVPGRTLMLTADRIGSLNLGSPIMYRDLEVGEILGWDIGEMAREITIHAFVRAPFDKYVHDNSRFWNASGASVKLGGNGVEFQIESLRAIILGGVAFETPNSGPDTAESEANHQFVLYQNKEAADSSVFKRSVPFLTNLTGTVTGLSAGSPVTLHGLKIGEVASLSLVYDRPTDTVLVPVHFTLEPERIAMLDLPTDGDLDSKMRQLVQQGLRVKLETANFLTGQKQLAMDVFTDAPAAKLEKQGEDYVIPAYGGSGDIATSAGALVSRLSDLPFEAIGKNLNQTLAGVSTLVNSKELTDSMAALRTTLASAQALVNNLNHGITPMTQRLPAIATGLEGAVKRTDTLISSLDNGYGGDSRFSRDVTHLMSQLSEAARSLRVLADLLSRHPEALIRGRTDQGSQ